MLMNTTFLEDSFLIKWQSREDMGQLCTGYREQHDWLPCMQIKRKTIQSLPGSEI